MATRSGDAVILFHAKYAVLRTATLVAVAALSLLFGGAEIAHAQDGETGKGTVYPQAYALLSSAAQKERAANDPGARAMQNAASTLYTLNAVILLSPGSYGDPWVDKGIAQARGPAIRACINLFNRQLIYIYRRDPHGADTAVAVVRMIAGEKGVVLLKDADFLTGNIPAGLVPYERSSKVAANELEQTIGTASKDNPLAGPITSPAPPRRPNPHAAENAQKPEVQATPSFNAAYKSMQQLGADAAGSFMAWTVLAAEDQENGLPGEKNDHVGTGALVVLWRTAIDHVNDIFHQEFAFALVRMQAARPGAGDAWLKQLYGAQNADGAAKAIAALDGIGPLSELDKNRAAQDHLHGLIGQVAGLMTRVQYKAGAFYSTGY